MRVRSSVTSSVTSFLDPDALITSQPVIITFVDGALKRRYTPDFLVCRAAQSVVGADLIEVKYEADLSANRVVLEPGFAAARAWASERQAAFRVVTEREIRGPLLQNAKRLTPLRTAPIDSDVAQLVLVAARSLESPTFGKVLATLPQSRSISLTTIWRLIARRELRVDLSAEITFDSPVSAI